MGIPPSPRGIPQIEVTFDIDANGIVDVSAKDLGTGTEQSIKIESQTSLSEEEISAKVSEAEEFASEDKRRKAGVTLINSADGMVYQATKMLKEAAEKISDIDTEPIHSKLEELRALITKDDNPIDVDDLDEAAVQAKMSEVEESLHEVSAKLYEAAAAEMAEEQSTDDSDNVVEADFEEVEPEDGEE